MSHMGFSCWMLQRRKFLENGTTLTVNIRQCSVQLTLILSVSITIVLLAILLISEWMFPSIHEFRHSAKFRFPEDYDLYTSYQFNLSRILALGDGLF